MKEKKKCNIGSEPIIIHKGYHVWCCETHKRPKPWCDNEREISEALEKQRNEIIRAVTPYCCHVSGMHNPTHFKENPEILCEIQKNKAYDRLMNHLDISLKPMVNPTGCYWCQTEKERKNE